MTQRALVLRLLRENGANGVSARELVYDHGITRGASVIHGLRRAGYSIETIDEGESRDGRRMLARYVLHGPRLRSAQLAGVENDASLPSPAELRLECGCVRSADGSHWERRCDRHGGKS